MALRSSNRKYRYRHGVDSNMVSTFDLPYIPETDKTTEYLNKGYRIIILDDEMYACKGKEKIRIQDKTWQMRRLKWKQRLCR